MGCVLFKIRKRLGIDFVNNYDLLVIPAFPFIKRLKEGNVKIISNKKIDYVYLKMPYNQNYNSKDLVLTFYRRLMDVIKVNEYKKVLINNISMSLINECCSFDNRNICHELYRFINDYIKDTDINVDIVISNKKDKKYYFD